MAKSSPTFLRYYRVFWRLLPNTLRFVFEASILMALGAILATLQIPNAEDRWSASTLYFFGMVFVYGLLFSTIPTHLAFFLTYLVRQLKTARPYHFFSTAAVLGTGAVYLSFHLAEMGTKEFWLSLPQPFPHGASVASVLLFTYRAWKLNIKDNEDGTDLAA